MASPVDSSCPDHVAALVTRMDGIENACERGLTSDVTHRFVMPVAPRRIAGLEGTALFPYGYSVMSKSGISHVSPPVAPPPPAALPRPARRGR